MTAQDIVLALGLPDGCRVDQRVPKKLLVENGAPTAADKRQINDGIEEIQWVAALKSNTIGVAEYRDDVREYMEITVLSVTLRGNAKAGRLAELVHRAVPYPLVLLLNSEQTLILSLAHKRWSQNEAGKVVLDGDVVSVSLLGEVPLSAVETSFIEALALGRQPQATLHMLYEGWMDSVQALLAARRSGMFKVADSPEQTVARRQALQECQRLELEQARLRTQAAKEKQLARQVEMNIELQRLQHELEAVMRQLFF
ncbi:MAG: DUF4391 domain-containing protein [Sulfuriferula sp.]